jgi:hypothetical protein
MSEHLIGPEIFKPARNVNQAGLGFKTTRIGFGLNSHPTGCRLLKIDRNPGRAGCSEDQTDPTKARRGLGIFNDVT